MTNSEKICADLGNLYFFKEMVKSNLLYTTNESKEEKELADVILRVGKYILPIQIKEMSDISKDIDKWMESKVYKKAKNQTKETCKNILKNIKFKNKTNVDILEDVENCKIIPIIIFDIKNNEIKYKRIYETKDKQLIINIFNLADFKKVCSKLISPMEMVRYIIERATYVQYKMIITEKNNQIILAKSKSEEALLYMYSENFNLELNSENKKKLIKFNTYLTQFEKHCVNNKDHYKQIIKILSQFHTKKYMNLLIE